jgi:hypothetical protein
MIFAALLRYLQIAFAYALASLFSGFAVAAVLYIRSEILKVPPAPDAVSFDLPFLFYAWLASVATGLWLAVPAHLLVVLAEWKSIRTPWYYVGVAAAGGVALGVIMQFFPLLPLIGLVLGVPAGGIYWAFAGRSAGRLNDRPRAAQLLLAVLAFAAVLIAVLMFAYLR